MQETNGKFTELKDISIGIAFSILESRGVVLLSQNVNYLTKCAKFFFPELLKNKSEFENRPTYIFLIFYPKINSSKGQMSLFKHQNNPFISLLMKR